MNRISQIIRPINSLNEREKRCEITPTPYDPAFHLTGVTHLRLDVRDWEYQASEYLDHTIARTPTDLRSHVQRVHLYIEINDAEAVYGALLDLFIVLIDRGRQLRERMLKLSKRLIENERYRYLLDHLGVGITALDNAPLSRKSILSKGITGTHRLVTKLNHSASPIQDPLQEAHDHLEYGQIEEARQVLENAIIKEPNRMELHHDLLDIYKRTNARQQFTAMGQRLVGDSNPVADAWRELADYFGKDT